ncbi:hypothetical protein HYR69_03985 [Candidatus Sumerlaeota bacterium]|nr:hypothetical protein [Candidatus Sumerlaeota bacterium]
MSKLSILEGRRIVEVGYEVCFFRDAAFYNLIPPNPSYKLKQTFDFCLFLDDGSIILIEAKAQQGFGRDQLQELKDARHIIKGIGMLGTRPIPQVHTAALCSSRYIASEETRDHFDLWLTWAEIAQDYSPVEMGSLNPYSRADGLYRDNSARKGGMMPVCTTQEGYAWK